MKTENKKLIIIAHKGGLYLKSKNFSYIDEAIRQGADIIELDIQQKPKMNYIVKHPINLPFINKRIIYPYQGTLKQALQKINSRKPIYLDTKDPSINPKKLISFVKKYHKNKIIVGSYFAKSLKKFRELDPNLIIVFHWLPLKSSIKKAKEIKANWMLPFFIFPGFAKKVKEAGLKLALVASDNPKKIRRCINLGADAIFIHDIKKFKQPYK